MTAQDPQSNEDSITERLFEYIDDLSRDMQLNLYKQLIKDKIRTQLFKLVVDMSDEEKMQLLEKLGTASFEEEPIKTINLDENESFMRENHRKNCLIEVKCKVGDISFTSNINNISVHGVFIEGKDRFPLGQRIRLAFQLPNFDHVLNFKGKINRSDLRGIGVIFLDMDQDQQEIIRAFIAGK